jgi:uncharacterized membrane protein
VPKLFSIKPGITVKGRSFKGVRGFAGKPFHPPLTDFPIAAYIFAAAFDVLSYFLTGRVAHDLYAAGTYTMLAGALVSLGTIATGFWDWWKGIDRDHSKGPLGKAKHTQVWRTINWHATVMATGSVIAVVDLLLRWQKLDAPRADLSTVVLSLLAAGVISYGSLYGGELVYDFQFNVESIDKSTAWDETELDQIPEAKPQSDW